MLNAEMSILQLDAGLFADDGTPDTFLIQRSGDEVVAKVNEAVAWTAPLSTPAMLRVSGTGGDTLMIDFSGGNPIPAGGVSFQATGHSGGPAAYLEILGGSAGVITSALAGAGQGQVRIDHSTVSFFGVGAISDTLHADAREVRFAAGAEQVTIAGTPGTDLSVMESTLSGRITIANPDTSLVIGSDNGAAGDRDVIDVTGLVFAGGRNLRVDAGSGTLLISGTIDAAGRGVGESGGSVYLLGDRVGLLDGALIDVNGHAGGGTVLVGGGLHGADTSIANATRAYVGSEAVIRADATGLGDGGTVVVWSEQYTAYYGHISVAGGQQGGHGGFVEVSGKEALLFRGTASAGALPGYRGGSILLDPRDVILDSISPSQVASDQPAGNVDVAFNALPDSATDVTLDVRAGGSFSGFDEISIQANRDIRLRSHWDVRNSIGSGANASLHLAAGRHIILGDGVAVNLSTGRVGGNEGHLVFVAGDDMILNGNVITDQAGTITLIADATVAELGFTPNDPASSQSPDNGTGQIQRTSGQLRAGTGAVTLHAATGISVFTDIDLLTIRNDGVGLIEVTEAGDVTVERVEQLGSQAVRLTAAGTIRLAGNVSTTHDELVVNAPLVLTTHVDIDTDGGDLRLQSTVDTQGFDLALDGGSRGDVVVSGTLSGGGNLTVRDSGVLRLGAVVVDTLTVLDTSTNVILRRDVSATQAIQVFAAGTISQRAAVLSGSQLDYDAGSTVDIRGPISISGSVDIDAGTAIQITAAGDLVAGGAVTFGAARPGAIVTAGDVHTTNADVTFARAVTLGGNVNIDTGSGAGNILFSSTVNTAGFDLSLNGGAAGDITLSGALSGGGDLTVRNGAVQSYQALSVGSLTILVATSSVSLVGNISAVAAITVHSGGAIVQQAAITAGSSLDYDAGTTIDIRAPITISGAVSIAAAGVTQIAAGGDIFAGSAVTFGATRPGTLFTAGNVAAANADITFARAVMLTGNVDIDTAPGAGDILFSSAISTLGFDLALSAGALGSVTLVGDLVGGGDLTVRDGAVQSFQALSVGNLTILNAATSVTFNGNTTATGAIAVNSGGSILQQAAIAAGSSLDYDAGTTISIQAPITISGAVDIDSIVATTIGPSGDIVAGGTVTFGATGPGMLEMAGDVATANADITFARVVTLTGNVDMDTGPGAADIHFSSTISAGGFDLSLGGGVSGSVTLVGDLVGGGDLTVREGAVQSFQALSVGNLTIQSAATSVTFNGNIAATGAITVNSGGAIWQRAAVTAGSSFAYDAGTTISIQAPITVSGAVDIDSMVATTIGPSGDIIAGGTVTFGAAGPGMLETAGDIDTANADVTFARAVTLTGSIQIDTGPDAGDIRFAGAVDGPFDLQLAGGGQARFLGPAGSASPLGDGRGAALTLSGLGTIEFSGTVRTASGIVQSDAAGLLVFRQDVTIGGGDTASALDAAVQLDGLVWISHVPTRFGNASSDQLTLSGGPVMIDTSSAGASQTFLAMVDGPHPLSIAAGAGNVTFGGPVGATSQFPALTIASAGDVRITAPMTIERFVQLAGSGTTHLSTLLRTSHPAGVDVTTGRFEMAGAATIDTGAGTISLSTVGNITLGRLVTTTMTTIASSNEAVVAANETGTDIASGSLALRAARGIGSDNPLKTAVSLLAASNTSSGSIRILNDVGGPLTIGGVGVVSGVENAGAEGEIVVSNHGSVTLAAGHAVLNSSGGSVLLTALGDGGDDHHLVIDGRVIASGGHGSIVLNAGADLTIHDTGFAVDVSVDGTGQIRGIAGREVLLGNDVLLQSGLREGRPGRGAVVALPPLMSALITPQVTATGIGTVLATFGHPGSRNFVFTVDWHDGTIDTFTNFDSLGNAIDLPGRFIFTHQYNGNPNRENPAADIPITVTMHGDENIIFEGRDTATRESLATTTGEGLSSDGVLGFLVDTTPKVTQLTAPQPLNIAVDPDRIPPPMAQTQTQEFRTTRSDELAQEERRVVLRVVSATGAEGEDIELPLDVLDDLPGFLSDLPDGRYRVYLIEPGSQQPLLVIDSIVRGGKPVDPSDELESDRPPTENGAAIHQPSGAPTRAERLDRILRRWGDSSCIGILPVRAGDNGGCSIGILPVRADGAIALHPLKPGGASGQHRLEAHATDADDWFGRSAASMGVAAGCALAACTQLEHWERRVDRVLRKYGQQERE